MSKLTFSSFRGLLLHSVKTFRREGSDRMLFYVVRYLSWKIQFHRRVRYLPKPVIYVLFITIKNLIRLIVKIFRRLYPNKYTDADPYKIIYVDPQKIKQTTGDMASKRRGWVVDGNWDHQGDTFMQRTLPKAIHQRFVQEMDWEDTVLSSRYDESDLRERGNKIDRTFDSIKQDGYLSQAVLLRDNNSVAWGGVNDTMHPLANEVAVDIGRDGELLWNMKGQHRLAIAKVLNVDEIPVQVYRRHSQWQETRDRIRNEEQVADEVRCHPDLRDIASPPSDKSN